MDNEHPLLDAFAVARRTWDDLITLQPDVQAATRRLSLEDLAELEKRVAVHYEAVQSLASALERMWVGQHR